MGYDLHVTRKADWSDEDGPEISREEVLAALPASSDFTVNTEAPDRLELCWRGDAGVLWWEDGDLWTKNPVPEFIPALAALAKTLDAKLQGDDGETYGELGSPEEPAMDAAPVRGEGILGRLTGWFKRGATPCDKSGSDPIKQGMRVENHLGAQGIVVAVDSRANGGLGNVRVRFDNGTEASLALVASGLRVIRP